MKGGNFIVIYVDVLFIINFFITFLLLSITSRLAKRSVRTFRLVIGSALGGAYSLIILVSLPPYVSLILKILSAALIIICTFGFLRVKSLVLILVIYLFSSFVFLGIIIGIYLIFKAQRIAVSNATVYFDIGARELLVSSFFAYVFSCIIVRLYNKKASAGEIYTLKIERQGQSVTLFALADSGNRLREPFTGESVIVVSRDKIERLMPEGEMRVIPASTVSGSSFLCAFKPDRVSLKNFKGEAAVENVYVALSDELNAEGYSAVFNPNILSV